MCELKKATSVWAADNHDRFFEWQEGYAAFTLSVTHREALREYIATQEEHHKKLSFIDELKELLKKNAVEYDPKDPL